MFYPIHITACPGFGFTGGPEFQTDIKNAQNGREYRNGDWAVTRHKYSVPFNNIDEEQYLNIKEVFLVVRGRLHTFLHKDWADHTATDAKFGVGNGSQTVFQLRKVSTVGAATYDRVITKPSGTIKVYVNGVQTTGFALDPLTGVVTMDSAPANTAVLTWSGEFDVQVRFDIDYLPFSLDNANAGGYFSNGTLDLLEVLDE